MQTGMFFTLNEKDIPILSNAINKDGNVILNKEDKKYVGISEKTQKTVLIDDDNLTSSFFVKGVLKDDYKIQMQDRYGFKPIVGSISTDADVLNELFLSNGDFRSVDGEFAIIAKMCSADGDTWEYFARSPLVPLYVNRQTSTVCTSPIKELGVTELIESGVWHTINNNQIEQIITKNIFSILRSFKK